ncbi:MAG: hypothetical protein PHN69_08365 [Candidatus Pacebacteria bacterium]|nr:hypothetical protein [Candidatus Paceibacterota bacterium]
MQIIIQPQSILFAIIGVGFASGLAVATYWLLNDTIAPKSSGSMSKTFIVYGEYTVTRQIAVIEANSEEEAAEMAKVKADDVAYDLGVDQPDIIWAEEKTK